MTIEYTQKYLELYPVTCDSCGCEVPTHTFDSVGVLRNEKRELCQFCAETLGGSYTQYDHRGDLSAFLRQEIWKAAACVVNHLTKAPPASEPVSPSHVLWETGDLGAPDAILDGHDEVAMGICDQQTRGSCYSEVIKTTLPFEVCK